MCWMWAALALAAPVTWTTDGGGARTAIHQPDGTVALWSGAGERIAQLAGPKELTALSWRGDTLVGTGPSGTWVWDTASGALLYKFAARGEPLLAEDGRVLEIGPYTLVIGGPVPEGLLR